MESSSATPSNSDSSRIGLLLRHASQNSLDESSQRNTSNSPEEDEFKAPFKNSTHFEKSFATFDLLRKDKLLCDVTLLADSQEIPAHKIVLASSSPYFYAMFTSFDEKDKERVRINEVDANALQLLVSYCYSGSIIITEESVQTLLPASNLLQMSDVKRACAEFLTTQLHPSNCLGIKAFADLHDCSDLLLAADSFIQFNFSEVVEGEEFLALNVSQVLSLITNDKLSVSSEETVFESVLNWVNFDRERREEWVGKLMEGVRLPLLSQEFLVGRVDEEPLLKSTECKTLIIEALKYHLLKGEHRASFTSPRTKPRKPVGPPKMLIVVGGQAPKAIRCVEGYDFKDETWKMLSDTPSRKCRAGLAYVNKKLYVVGGFNGSLRVKNVEIFDPLTGKWSFGPNMIARRSTLGVAVLNNFIYAVGGFDGSTGLSSAEKFDIEKNEWLSIAAMSTRRSSVGVGVIEGKLYAVGGYDGQSRNCLSSVESYDPETDTWSKVADMSFRRSGAGVGVLKVGEIEKLFVVGGHDGPTVRNSCEVYDIGRNEWRKIADMKTCRRNAGVIAINGNLIVVGGDDGNSNLNTVEIYDNENDCWDYLSASMQVRRSYAGVAVVDKPTGI